MRKTPDTSVSLAELLKQLMAFPTVAGQTQAMEDCFDYVATFLTEHTMNVTRASSNGLPSLMATTQSTKTPKVLLQAHLDVVPAKADLFQLKEKAGKLYGRGAFDMKFAAACYLQLVDALQDGLKNYDFGIMFTADEEIGGENGVRYLLNQGYGATVCLLPDGGDDWCLEKTCNAVWIVRIIAKGQSAHGSRPWEGHNAINDLLDGLRAIQTAFGELKPHNNSLTISQIQGGSAMNQVPDQAEATLDMRFTDDKEHAKYAKVVQKIVQDSGLELKPVARVEARNVDVTQPEVCSFLKIAEELRGKPITKTHSFGASDACYFADHNIPTIVIRPSGGGAHSDREWIGTAELLKFYEVIKTYVIQTTKVP